MGQYYSWDCFQQLHQKCLPAQVFRYSLKLCVSWSLNIGDTFLLYEINSLLLNY